MEKYDFGLSDLFGEGSNKLTATITIKADVNGTVSIDGSYVASIKTSEPIQTECGMGQHIIKVKTEKHPDIFKETILDIDTPGRNYLVIIDGLSSLVAKAEKVSTGFSSKGIFMLFAKRKKVAPVAVDMGLSVKWANANLGADNPEGYGDYYAWAEKKTKKDYSDKEYKERWDRYVYADAVLEKADDVAHKILGSGWRIPTEDECRELINNCTCTWTKQNGVEGILATSKRNGNSIFFPAAGRRIGSNLCRAHFEGYYWTSCHCFGGSSYCIRIASEGERYRVGVAEDECVYGLTVRPVKE